MKSLTMSVFLFAFLLSCSSQDIPSKKVPSVVLNTVVKNYPGNNEVDWKKVRSNYEAEIKINDSTDITFQIDENGKILKQKQDISNSVIPSTVTSIITTDYAGYLIDDVEKLEISGNVYYQVELETNGKKDLHLVFAPDGKLVEEVKYWD